MKQEVELRAVLTPAQRKSIALRLRKMGFRRKGITSLRDRYYCPKTVRSFAEIEMNEVGSYSLRLREAKDGRSFLADLNVKVITEHGDHHSWREHEIEIDSFGEGDAILKALGFKDFFTLEKKRTIYQKKDATVCIEDIRQFKPCIEVEILTTRAAAEAAKAAIGTILDRLGVGADQVVSKSITNMLMRERARF